jgi:hypothetical protein
LAKSLDAGDDAALGHTNGLRYTRQPRRRSLGYQLKKYAEEDGKKLVTKRLYQHKINSVQKLESFWMRPIIQYAGEFLAKTSDFRLSYTQ